MHISDKKLIVITPVKNEDRILDLFLSCTSLRADFIIIADQNSTDKTAEICQKYDKVIYIKNNFEWLNQSVARQLLLDESRKIKWDKILFALDADEIISWSVMNNNNFKSILINLNQWESIELEWINLRWAYDRFCNDNSIRKPSWKHFIFKDNWVSNFDLSKTTSEPRMPEFFMQKSTRFNNIKVFHFQFVNHVRMLAKQKRYRIWDFINSKYPSFRSAFKINLMYYPSKIWLLKKTNKVNVNDFSLYWDRIRHWSKTQWNKTISRHEYEIIEHLIKYGVNYFKRIDIWDTNRNMKANEIWITWDFKDPRNILIKIYHESQQILYFINKFIPRYLKKIFYIF